MYCKNCGAYVEDSALYCGMCGTAQQQTADPCTPCSQEKDPKAMESAATNILIWGGLGLFFALNLPLLGFIFSCIARKKVTEYEQIYGEAKDMAGIGKGLAIAGFIVGLVLTIIASLSLLSVFSFGFLFSFI